jgi:hypothetical protein
VERDLLTPSDRLTRALADEFQCPELYHLAGKLIPTNLAIAERYAHVRANYANKNIRDLYPRSDPFLRYGQDFPGILNFDDLQELKFLADVGVDPGDIDIYPPIRKILIDVEIEQNMEQGDFDTFDAIEKLRSERQEPAQFKKLAYSYFNFYRLAGQAIGLRQALQTLNDQQEKGDYYLLAAFYEPTVARALADNLKIIRRLIGKEADRKKENTPS